MVRSLGGVNKDSSGAVYANEMVSASATASTTATRTPQTLSTTVLWNWGADRMNQSVNAEKLSGLHGQLERQGRGQRSNGLDLHGSPENNPFFVRSPPTHSDSLRTSTSRREAPPRWRSRPARGHPAKTLGVRANVRGPRCVGQRRLGRRRR